MPAVKENTNATAAFSPEILRDPEKRRAYSATAMKAFVRMMDEWNAPVAQRCAILGDIPQQTYYKWARGEVTTLSRDQLERIGVTLGIYKGLRILFNDEGGRNRWFKSANHDYAFRGQTPVDRMAAGSITDLYAVREYVDGMRGAH